LFFQKLVGRFPKADVYLDVTELLSGIFLVGFVWTHSLFVATILFGTRIFNQVPAILDAIGISYIGITLVILVIILHMVIAGRRIPSRFHDQRVVWQHARRLAHMDTWTWMFQVVTGVGILVMVSIHIWSVLTGWPITASTSAGRVQSHSFFFDLIFLVFVQFHAGIGIYRQFVKWGWIHRKKVFPVVIGIAACMVGLGVASIFMFRFFLEVGGGK
jgi:fumarate reductase subunit C